jgi:hypothetical protein
MHRLLLPLFAAAALMSGATAQTTDFAGIVAFTKFTDGTVRDVVQSYCQNNGTFDCVPLQLQGLQGDGTWVTLTGELNGAFVLFASPDTQNLQCTPLVGLPFLVNSLILPFPPTTIPVFLGTMTTPDSRGCGGGIWAQDPNIPLFTIPGTTPSGTQLALQAVVQTPISAGGSGFAFTRAVVLTVQ